MLWAETLAFSISSWFYLQSGYSLGGYSLCAQPDTESLARPRLRRARITRRPVGVCILARNPETLLRLRLVPSRVRFVINTCSTSQKVTVYKYSILLMKLRRGICEKVRETPPEDFAVGAHLPQGLLKDLIASLWAILDSNQ